LIFFIGFGKLNAQSQILGGEIYYKQINSFKYIVTLQMYRDCRGSSLDSINGFVYAGTGKYAMNFKRISIENISESCDTGCKTSNTTSGKGTEKHIYKDTIDFTQSPYDSIRKNKLCEVYFSVYVKGWNGAFTTIQNPNVYLDAMLNICHPDANIHSPEFNNKPFFNVCCNQAFRYNPGILKHNDIDSFSFELASVLNDYNKKVTYTSDFIPTIPMSPFCPPRPAVVNCRPSPNRNPPIGFYFNPLISDIVFTPNVCDEVGAIKFQVKQWRFNSKTKKMDLIGYVNRQILLIVHQCPDNNPPNFSSGTNNYNICIGDSLKLNFATKDDPFLLNQKKSDTTIVSWSNNLENASFSYLDSKAREKTAVLKWKAKGNPYQITQKYIYLKVIDKHCNTQESKGVLINVFPKINFKINSKDIKGCNYYQVSTIYPDSFKSIVDLKYDYKIWNINSPDKIIKHISKKSDTFQYITSGTYIIRYEISNHNFFCKNIVFDTIIINQLSVLGNRIKDSLVCQNDEIILGNTNFSDSFTTYTWQTPFSKTIGNYQFPYLKIKANQPKQNIRLIINNKNCQQISSATLTTRNGFDLNVFKNDTVVCAYKFFKLELKNINTSPSSQFFWSLGNQYVGIFYPYFDYKYSNNTKVKIIQNDNSNCPFEKIIDIKVSEIDKFSFNTKTICNNNISVISPNYLMPKNTIKKYEWNNNSINLKIDSANLRYNFKSPSDVKLKLLDFFGCESEKNISFLFYPSFKVKILGDSNYNYHEFVKLSADQDFQSYVWSNNSQAKNNNFWAKTLGLAGNHKVNLTAIDSNGCKNFTSINLNTNQSTNLQTPTSVSFQIYPNPSNGIFTINTKIGGVVEVFSISGKLLLTHAVQEGENTLNLQLWSKGIYFLKFEEKVYKLVIG